MYVYNFLLHFGVAGKDKITPRMAKCLYETGEKTLRKLLSTIIITRALPKKIEHLGIIGL